MVGPLAMGIVYPEKTGRGGKSIGTWHWDFRRPIRFGAADRCRVKVKI